MKLCTVNVLTKDNNILVVDEFFGAATVEEALFAYNKPLLLPQELGSETSPEKCFQPSICMISLSILFNKPLLFLQVLGSETSPEKCFQPSTCMISLSILFNKPLLSCKNLAQKLHPKNVFSPRPA